MPRLRAGLILAGTTTGVGMKEDLVGGELELDLGRYELRLGGEPVRLERQPMELFILLAERPQQLVTREEIVAKLWGEEVFVDVDRGINKAIRKLRLALHDNPESPRYLETVVGKGYRLISPVRVLPGVPAAVLPANASTRENQRFSVNVERELSGGPHSKKWLLAVAALAIILSLALAFRSRSVRFERPSIRSIAVLPLDNLSGDPAQDYFAAGMTEELTTDLGKLSSLKVVSRTSAQKYRFSNKSAPQIAQELKVDAIIEGSVLRSGNKVRITTQLIDAVHDRHLWAETYERDVGDVLAVQNTVALEIARQVRIRLTPEERQRFEKHILVNPDAYDAYLHGRYLQTTQSAENMKAALAAFHQAVNLDPTYAPAYAGVADGYSLLANYWVLTPSEAFPQAAAAAEKALQLDPASAEATWPWPTPCIITVGIGRALSVNIRPPFRSTPVIPQPTFVMPSISPALAVTMRRSQRCTVPWNWSRSQCCIPRISAVFCSTRTVMVRPSRSCNRVWPWIPTASTPRMHLAMSYEAQGRNVDALEQYQRILAVFGQPGPGVAHLYATTSQPAKARRIVDHLRRNARDSDWFFLAGVYAALGDNDQAFACLDQAYKKHDFYLVFLKVHPYMEPLRSDPRYRDLVKRLGLDRVGTSQS